LGKRLVSAIFCIAQWRSGHTSRRCNTIFGLGVVPFTMESLGAYLFAGAFRFLGAPRVSAVDQKAPATLDVLMQKRGKRAAIDALLPAGRD
jgi:hypothetical protein